MTRADLTSTGTWDPNNWVTHLPDGGLVGTSGNVAAIAQWLSRVMDETLSTHLTFTAHPVNQEKWEGVAKNVVQRRVRSTLGHNKDGKAEGIGENVVSLKPVKDDRDCPHCVNQAGMKHCLEDCICACPKGFLAGCILCDSVNHSMDACALFQKTTLAEKVNWLVVKRANKPALKSEVPWHKVLHEFCMSSEFDADMFQGFPWTGLFAVDRYNRTNKTYLPGIQRKFDASRNFPLPVDDYTKSFKDIWETYWKKQGLPWPEEGLGPLEEEMVNFDDFAEDAGPDGGFSDNDFDDFVNQTGTLTSAPPASGCGDGSGNPVDFTS